MCSAFTFDDYTSPHFLLGRHAYSKYYDGFMSRMQNNADSDDDEDENTTHVEYELFLQYVAKRESQPANRAERRQKVFDPVDNSVEPSADLDRVTPQPQYKWIEDESHEVLPEIVQGQIVPYMDVTTKGEGLSVKNILSTKEMEIEPEKEPGKFRPFVSTKEIENQDPRQIANYSLIFSKYTRQDREYLSNFLEWTYHCGDTNVADLYNALLDYEDRYESRKQKLITEARGQVFSQKSFLEEFDQQLDEQKRNRTTEGTVRISEIHPFPMKDDEMLPGGGRNQRPRKMKRRNKRRRGGGRGGGFMQGPSSFGVANRMNDVKLTFTEDIVLNNATLLNPYGFSFFVMTNPIDLNQNSATNEPFFTAYKGMYRKYRVRKYSVRATFMNAENYGIKGYLSIVNFAPTNTAANNLAAVQNSRRCYCSGKGGMDRATCVVKGSVRKAGFATTMTEDSFVSVTDGTSSPADNIYVVCGTDTNGVASVSGVEVGISIVLHIDFMERQLPSS